MSDKQVGRCWGLSTDLHRLCNFFTELPEYHYFFITIKFLGLTKSLTIFSTILLCVRTFPFHQSSYEDQLNSATERDHSIFNDCANWYRISLNDIFCPYTRAGTNRGILPVPGIFRNFKRCW